MLESVVIIKAILEVAMLALLGQGLLFLLAGANREQNLFYQVLRVIASPPVRLARLLTPRVVPDKMIGYIAFSMLLSAWAIATFYKICLSINAC